MRVALLVVVAAAGLVSTAFAQSAGVDRLPAEQLEVVPPSDRVNGAPGQMTIASTDCRPGRASDVPLGVRQRIVDVAVQEWAFFGFSVVDRTSEPDERPRFSRRRGFSWLDPDESARVAESIAGYWAVTPEGSWILEAQNGEWNGPRGVAARWRYPWSAAFISWVMCEGGLAERAQFQRAVAHHTYIDQAIRARDGDAPEAAYEAFEIGEAALAPGDLLCSARRPSYRSVAERRVQMGDGARTHCDVVVQLDETAERILAIGGNVRGVVSLKLLPARHDETADTLRPVAPGSGARSRPAFAHLKLRAAPIASDALDRSPTMRGLACAASFQPPTQLHVAGLGLVRPGPEAVSC